MGQASERARRRVEREQAAHAAQRSARETPRPDASRAAIEDLIAIWPLNPVVTVTASDDAYLRSLTIWVFAEHAVRTARAVLALDDARMYMQCAPLARLVYECGMTAAWMVRTPFSGHSIFTAAKQQHDLLFDGLAKMTGMPVPEDDEDAMAGLEGAPKLPKFWERVKALDGGRWIYTYYRLLSGVSHAEGLLVGAYLEQADVDHEHGHRFQFRPPERFQLRDVVLVLTVVALNFALWSWDEVSEDHALLAELERVGKKHGLGSRPIFDHEDPARTAEPET